MQVKFDLEFSFWTIQIALVWFQLIVMKFKDSVT